MPDRDPWRVLTLLAVTGLVLAAVMAVAGLPTIDMHGPIHHLGIMDPTCGGTRSVRLAALGQWSASWRYNPLGVPLVVGAILLLARAALGLLSGRWVSVKIGWTRSRGRALIVFAVILVVALEINQQAHAALLLTRR
jgi:NADH:ubiquinone oxidoreductase subunit 6 (subunit J)